MIFTSVADLGGGGGGRGQTPSPSGIRHPADPKGPPTILRYRFLDAPLYFCLTDHLAFLKAPSGERAKELVFVQYFPCCAENIVKLGSI